MCGICGCSGPSGWLDHNAERNFRVALERLSHRGPDATGQARFPSALLGHQRLSIIDTEARSNQPMFTDDGRFSIVFNGEIYNYRKLKADLAEKGSVFKTESDTEVLLELVRDFQPEFLNKLRGMFAFALYDRERNRLFLARDPFGKKPLYWGISGRSIWFSSEFRSLTAAIPPGRLHQLPSFLQFQSPEPDDGLFENIREVPAGGWLIWENENISEGTYFSLTDSIKAAEQSGPVSGEEFSRVFRHAVTSRLISDVPVGVFLSGGIDSTAIVHAMAEQGPVSSFTIGFKNQTDERKIAAATALRAGANHTFLELDPDETVHWIPQAVQDMDIPSADAINTWIVSRVAKRAGITVALTGLGGDEWFGGYPSARFLPFHAGFRHLRLLTGVVEAPAFLPLKVRKVFDAIAAGTVDGYARSMRTVFDPVLLKQAGLTVPQKSCLPEDGFSLHPDNTLALAEFEYYCKRLLLRDSDQMSMAHALELRVPFLDVDFLNVAARMNAFPPRRTINHKKWRFIQQFPEWFPTEIVSQPKTGFALPMERWMRGPLRDFVLQGLHEPVLKSLLNADVPVQWFGAFLEGRSNPGWSRIWLVAVLGHWISKNKLHL